MGQRPDQDRRGLFLQTPVRRSGGEACSYPFKTIRALPSHTAISPRATPIWGGSTKRERSSPRLRAITACSHAERHLPFGNPEDRELFLSGLRLATGEADMSQTRRLAAILAADVAGYSRLMGADEEGTLERLKALRRELLDPKIAEHQGRIVKTTGDGMLVEFASVVDAVRCAVEVQQAMPERNTGVAADNRIELRIGINLGDVIVEGDDLYGDGVNIAARIEAAGRCRRGVRLQHGS